MVGGEADDLAAAGGAGERGEAVLEDHHVVVAVRDLALVAAGPGRAERACVGGGQVGAALAVRGDGDEVAEQRVPADLGGGGHLVGRARVGGVALPAVVPVVVDELAAVGQPGRGLLHASTLTHPYQST